MSSPGVREVARLRATVRPYSVGFGAELRKTLNEYEKRHRIRIGVALDIRGVDNDLRALADTVSKAARIRVPATVDTRGLRAEVAAVARVAGLGQAVRIGAELDTRAAELAAAQVRQVAANADGGTVALRARVEGAREAATAVSGLARSLLSVGARTAGLTGLATAGVGLAAALGQAAGSAALLPGALALGGAAALTLSVGLRGVGDALAAAGDPAAFAAAVAELAPAAGDTVREIAALGPQFRGLRLDVQERLFSGLAGTVSGLAEQYLPVLRAGMVGVAGEFNTAASGVADFAGSAQTVGDTATLFENVRRSIAALAPAAVSVLQAFRDIGTVGSTVVADLVPGLNSAGQSFGDFIARARESGALEQFLRSSVDTLQRFGFLLGNVGSILFEVLSAGADTGSSLLDTLVSITGAMVQFLRSAQGQEALSTFFETAGLGAQLLFGAISALAPAIQPLLSIVANLARAGFGALTAVLNSLAPVAVKLAESLRPVSEQLGGALLEAAELLAPRIAEIAGIAGQALVSALSALTPVLPVIVAGFAQFAGILANGVLGPVLSTLASIVPVVANAFAQAAPILPLVANAVAQLVSAILPLVPPIVELAASAIPPLVAWLQFLIPAVTGAAQVVLGILVPALSFLAGILQSVVEFATGIFVRLLSFLSDNWTQTANRAREIYAQIEAAVTGPIRSATEFVRNAWNFAVGWVRDAWQGLRNAVAGGADSTVAYVRDLPGRILSALGNVAGLLFDAGKSIVEGLINGIGAMISRAVQRVRDLGASIVNEIGNFLGINSPSRVFFELGRYTAEGFALGLSDGAPLAESAANDLAGAVMFSPPAVPNTGGGGNIINVYPRADQSEWSIATQVDRSLSFAGRF